MAYLTPQQISEIADERRLRKAVFVTALDKEMDAVRGHLEHLGSVVGRDEAIYECGVFSDPAGEWLVVVVETGAGNHEAQGRVTNAYVTLGPFELQVFTGVGGSRKSDVPLGSVVAGSWVYTPYPGKYGEGGRSSRPRGYKLGRTLDGIARKVARDREWQNEIRPPLNGTLPAADQYPVNMPALATVAPIVSVEAVSADPSSELEALIAREFGDAAVVEMEGYGAQFAAEVENTPAIVIRGVSDMAQNKNPDTDADLQPIAACHAAAFGFALLRHWAQIVERAPDPSAPRQFPIPPSDSQHSHAEPATATASSAGSSMPVDIAVAETTPAAARSATSIGRSLIVLNFDADADTFDTEKVAALQAALRTITKTEDLSIIQIARGSVRAFVDDPTHALERIGLPKLRDELARSSGLALTGMVREEDLDELDRDRAALARASAELLAWPQSLPDGGWIERGEYDDLLRRIESEEPTTTALLGGPGVGKSALTARLAQALVDRSTPVLAIKADLLEPHVATEDDLRVTLGLEDPPSTVLIRLARLRPVVLIIDQLDALASYLDLRTARLSVLLNLIRHLGGRANIHIVLTSRRFEFNHDVRLRSVDAEALTLELPAWSEVVNLLEARGVDAHGWPADAQEVMRAPQALATYLQLDEPSRSAPFSSYQKMLDRLWHERLLSQSDGAGMAALAGRVATEMAEEESLWLARARFDDQPAALNGLIAAGILSPYGSADTIGFSHQTLFEHALARTFAREKGRLSAYVLERQSSLFVRPKAWAGLTYIREVEPAAYHTELETIWNAPGLRAHVQRLLIDFLGQQSAPTDREALLMEAALKSPDNRPAAFQAMLGSPGWFSRFSRTYISTAMRDAAGGADQVVGLLIAAWPIDAEEVTKLVDKNWKDVVHDVRAWMTIQNAVAWNDTLLDVARRILARTEISDWAVDHVIATVGVEQPDFALRLVRTRLEMSLTEAVSQAEALAAIPRPDGMTHDQELSWYMTSRPGRAIEKFVEGQTSWDSLPALAAQSPALFMKEVWPWFVEAATALRRVAPGDQGTFGYSSPYALDFRFDEEDTHGLPEPALLEAVRTAAEQLAVQAPTEFLAWFKAQAEVDSAAVQRLLAHVLSLTPDVFADAAFDFLLADERRFVLGASGDVRGTTKRLVRAVAPFWSSQQVMQFEQALAAFSPPPRPWHSTASDRRGWSRFVRRTRLELLRALPARQLTELSRRKISEETRVFGAADIGLSSSGVRTIGSIMEAEDIARAADDDVLRAFEILPDDTEWDHPRDWGSGGNIQLSRAFATFAKAEPERAARLIQRFDPVRGVRAAGYAVSALAEKDDPEHVVTLILHLAALGFDGEEYRGNIARAVEQLVDRDVKIDDPVVDLLEGWLASPLQAGTVDQDVNAELDTGQVEAEPSDDATTTSLLWGYGGLSIVPAGVYPVLEALTRARLARGESDALLDRLETCTATIRDAKTWEGLLRFFIYMAPKRPERRIEVLARILEATPALTGSKAAAHLLAQAQWWDTAFVQRQLQAWRSLGSAKGLQAYGELVALIAMMQPEEAWAREALDALIAAPEMVKARAGAALSLANTWEQAGVRSRALAPFNALLETGEAGVWRAVFDLFRLVDALEPDDDTVSLLSSIEIHLHRAPKVGQTFIVDRLQGLLPHQAPLVARLATALVDLWVTELGDVRTGIAATAPELVDLAITLHRIGPETREAGTTLFERLIAVDAYMARQTLDELDNRFRTNRAPVRSRLGRRAGRGARRRRA